MRRIAEEIDDATKEATRLGLVGIQRGGVPVAERLKSLLEAAGRSVSPLGSVDIALYRDDAATAGPDLSIGPTDVPFEVERSELVLVDDVLQTGRTVRAAIECLLDYGRPNRLWFAALVDRGGRELPIAPDFVGEVLDVPKKTRVTLRPKGVATGHDLAALAVEARDPAASGSTP